MANDKTYDRHINIWINGKEVKNDISSIKKEMFNLTNEEGRMTRGTQEYNDKVAELTKVKQILKEHQESISATGGMWEKLKGSFGMVTAAIGIGYGIFQSLKGIIESTDDSSDKFAKTMGGVKEAIGEVSRAMADGNFKDFFKNIEGAVEEGQRYVDTQDAIGDSARALSLEEEKVADEILALKIIQADATKSREEQIKAGEEIEQKQSQLADKRAQQAQKTLDNEMENARFRSKLDDATIKSFLLQDETMMKSLGVGKQYYDLVQKYRGLTTTQLILQGGKIKDQMAALGSEAPKFAALYAATSKITEAQRDKIINAEKAVAEAKRSATEDILRQVNKLNSARAAEAAEAVKASEEIKKADEDQKKAHKEQEIQAEQENQKFIDDEIKRMDKEANAKREYDARVEKENQDFIDREIKRMEEEAQTKHDLEVAAEKKNMDFIDREINRMEEEARIKEEYDNKLLDAKKKVAQEAEKLASALFARQEAKLDKQYKKDIADAGDNAELKAKIDEEYAIKKHKLAQRAAIFEKAAAIAGIAIAVAKGVAEATAAAVVTLGASLALIPWIIAAGVLQTAAVVAQPIAEFAKGGYTGPGGQHEPAGFVHKGEWVANADMVASPRTGPIIQALEYYRNNNMPGYSNGGMAAGSGGSGGGGSVPAALIASDPEMKTQLGRLSAILDRLERNGVKNNWPWNDVNNMRKGMDKLDEIEGNVSL
jgi:hypothetical protein